MAAQFLVCLAVRGVKRATVFVNFVSFGHPRDQSNKKSTKFTYLVNAYWRRGGESDVSFNELFVYLLCDN